MSMSKNRFKATSGTALNEPWPPYSGNGAGQSPTLVRIQTAGLQATPRTTYACGLCSALITAARSGALQQNGTHFAFHVALGN